MKHTKGNWHLESEIAEKDAYPAYELTINFSTNRIGCVSVFCNSETPTPEELANAKLIAAAPELLEFIDRMASEDNFFDQEDRQEAINLIKKVIL